MASSGATQINQHLAIETVLGEDTLLIRSFQGVEQLGRLFEYQAEVVSQQSVSMDKLVGTNATISLRMFVTPGGGGIAEVKTRFFNAFISRISLGECLTDKMAKYQITLVPWLWFLTRTSDCRIFQEKSIPDIIEETFKKHAFSNYKLDLSEDHQAWEYLVQYRETDFNFLNRLMEQEGIYYYFTHEDGQHTLIVTDSMTSHQPVEHFEELVFRPTDSGERTAYDINTWSVSKEVKPGVYTHSDFNFKTPKPSPNLKLLSRSSIAREHEQAEYEIFDSPGEYETLGQGDNLSRLRMEELQSEHEVAQGTTVARAIFPGSTFTLKKHPLGEGSQNREYLLTKARYDAQAEEFTSGAAGMKQHFSCHFSCIPLSQVFRLPRVTPKPVISGPQTAMVVGPQGEEIYTDEFGRVKVQFHWDRHGKYDAESSCWIRVSQGWAGINWGSITLPRVGQEVIVEFLEGDPDRPIITGRVYNADCMPPYPLPDEKSKSTIKSLSYPGGGGFNELRFEDKKGEEQVFLHAEKDKDERVEDTSKEFVGNQRHLIVGDDQMEEVKGDKYQKVAGEHAEFVGETISTEAGQDIQRKAGLNYGLEAGTNIHLNAKMNTVIEAGAGMTLKCGSSFITIDPSGVSISGPMIRINSGGRALSGPGVVITEPMKAAVADDDSEGRVSENPLDAHDGFSEDPPSPSPEEKTSNNDSTASDPNDSCWKKATGPSNKSIAKTTIENANKEMLGQISDRLEETPSEKLKRESQQIKNNQVRDDVKRKQKRRKSTRAKMNSAIQYNYPEGGEIHGNRKSSAALKESRKAHIAKNGPPKAGKALAKSGKIAVVYKLLEKATEFISTGKTTIEKKDAVDLGVATGSGAAFSAVGFFFGGPIGAGIGFLAGLAFDHFVADTAAEYIDCVTGGPMELTVETPKNVI